LSGYTFSNSRAKHFVFIKAQRNCLACQKFLKLSPKAVVSINEKKLGHHIPYSLSQHFKNPGILTFGLIRVVVKFSFTDPFIQVCPSMVQWLEGKNDKK
jgi:hypothetical protein